MVSQFVIFSYLRIDHEIVFIDHLLLAGFYHGYK